MPPISVGNGLVTSQDISTIPDGSLSRANDSYYKPNNQALWKAQGRSAFNATAESGSILGVRALTYDGATDLLVVHVGTTYRKATLAATGTFADLVTGLTGGIMMDSVHYNNVHILLNGVDRGRVVDSAAAVTLHGMLANTAAPTADATTGTGITISSGSNLKYWVEERVKSGTTVLRRNAATADEVVTVSGTVTNKAIIITKATTVNSDATHWALFGTATDGSFPTGAEINEVVIATTTITDTRTAGAPTVDPALPSGDEYDIVSASIAGLITNVAKNGPPPTMETADVLEDSLYGWDVNNKSIIQYSVPDEIHKWPSLYKIRFESKEEDEGVAVRTIGQIGVALMRDSVWRIQTLPVPEDAAFQPERVKTQIDGAFGCAGALAVDSFSMGGGPRLAYISPDGGLIITDGYDWGTVHDDLNWEDTVDVSKLSTARLTNNPSEYRLEMIATEKSTGLVKQWFFHYHSTHLKEASQQGTVTFKVTGPINLQATSKTRGLLNGKRRLFSGHTNGVVYLDAGQEADGAGNTISMDVETKEYYFAGVGVRNRLTRLHCHHQAGTATQTATVDLIEKNPGEDESPTPETVSLARREATPVYIEGHAEAFRLRFRNSDSAGPVSLDYFIANVTDAEEARGA